MASIHKTFVQTFDGGESEVNLGIGDLRNAKFYVTPEFDGEAAGLYYLTLNGGQNVIYQCSWDGAIIQSESQIGSAFNFPLGVAQGATVLRWNKPIDASVILTIVAL